jgi:hypothetical protein
MPMTQIHWMLLATGYRPKSQVGKAVSEAIMKAFELLGDSCSSLIINHLSKIHNLPPHIVIARYDLVDKAIGQVCGYGSEVFLHYIRENLLESLPGTDPFLPTAEIIKNAYKEEVLSFLRNIRNEPAILLYNSHTVREEMLRIFVREHFSASGFVNSANGLEMVSCGPGCSHPPEGKAGKYGPFLCSYGAREAGQNFQDGAFP